MFDRALIFQTHVALGQLALSKEACGLMAPTRPWPDIVPQDTVCRFGSGIHDDQSVLALTFGVGQQRVTWLLDAWARSTVDALESARVASGYFVMYADRSDLTSVDFAPVRPAEVDAMLGQLETHRRGRFALEPATFVSRAMHVDVIAEHAVHLHHPERHFPGLPGSASVTVLLGPEHIRALSMDS